MSNTNTNKPTFPNWPESAFPSTFESADPESGQVHRWGMTLRDYFAAKAMQAEMAQGIHESDFDWMVARCYKVADAMLAARSQA